jgi:hypothetical protein
MPLLEFEGCRERVRRAKAHREIMAKAWREIGEAEDFYSVGVRMKDDGAGTIWVVPHVPESFTSFFALELGEMLYQLRAALDSCVYHAAILETGKNPPPDENHLEFPIYRKRREYSNNEARVLGPLIKKRRDIIQSVQPYNAPKLAPEDRVFNFNRALDILNEWARKDRHRTLHVVGSWASNLSPKIRCPAGATLKSIKTTGSGFLDNKDVIATFRLSGYKRGMEVQANPDLDIDIAVQEAPPPCADTDTLGNRLLAMLKATTVIVDSIERSF